MASKKQAGKRTAQSLNISSTTTPTKPVRSKISKANSEENIVDQSEDGETINLKSIHDMMKAMMKKLEKLDSIDTRVKTVESDLKSVKESIEFAHAEIRELKKDNENRKKTDETTKERIEKLEKEKENEILNKSVIDLKSRSMRDNLIFYNIPESKDEDTTNIIHKLLEEKLHLEDASKKIKIDRTHRLGRQKQAAEKPRPIIAKFNFYQDQARRIFVSTQRN
ncbi:Hypothetical predicted protein [Paramuricea clavata]|uniref:Uncharacterized protein n=1 Tax=Paramuricea clavata TaxID=317549 RepID=A0A7D9JBG7_PARCT|nr:Hypothetical predicted protein [Paramuricea clavata]